MKTKLHGDSLLYIALIYNCISSLKETKSKKIKLALLMNLLIDMKSHILVRTNIQYVLSQKSCANSNLIGVLNFSNLPKINENVLGNKIQSKLVCRIFQV